MKLYIATPINSRLEYVKHSRRIRQDKIPLLRQWLQEGVADKEIAQRLGINVGTWRTWLVCARDEYHLPYRHVWGRFNRPLVASIAEMRLRKMSWKEIAEANKIDIDPGYLRHFMSDRARARGLPLREYFSRVIQANRRYTKH